MHDERERVIDVHGERIIPALAEDDGCAGAPAAHARRRPGGPHR
ncbi:hypothetical protein [Streptomyces sp. PT12]|nr:hypothetical protein [Streptomyces sp. PT12]